MEPVQFLVQLSPGRSPASGIDQHKTKKTNPGRKKGVTGKKEKGTRFGEKRDI